MTSNYDAFVVQRERAGREPHPSLKDVQISRITGASAANASSPSVQFNVTVQPDDFVDWTAMSTGLSYQKVYTMTCPNVAGAGGSPFSLGPKPAGNLADIASITVRVQGSQITTAPGMLPIWNYVRYMLRTSPDEHQILGPLLGMGTCLPHEEVESWFVGSSSPTVISNCSMVRPAPDLVALDPLLGVGGVLSPSLYNKALFSRIRDMCYATGATAMNGRNTFNRESTNAAPCIWTSQCFIPMRFLHDFFEKCGVLKGVSLVMTVNFNNCSAYSAVPAASATGSAYPGGVLSTAVPVLSSQGITSFQQTEMACALTDLLPTGAIAATSVAQSQSAAIAAFANAGSVAITIKVECAAAQIPEILLTLVTPQAGEGSGSSSSDLARFSSGKKTVMYSDHQVSQLSGQGATSTIQWQIAPSAQGIQRVYIFGYLSASAKLSQLSPFAEATPEPFYSHPYFAVNTPVFIVAGSNIKKLPTDYQFRDFAENLLTMAPVNGGQSTAFTSGLYSKRAWDISKIYAMDLSRYTRAAASSSLEFRATNASLGPIDLLAIYEINQEVTIDQSAGAITVISGASVPVLQE